MIYTILIAISVSLCLVVIFISARRHKDRKILYGMHFAHRGLHNMQNGIPENSISAFATATALGYGIENDIQITADGRVVVFHDKTLKRMCGTDALIEKLTLAEIKKYRLLNTDEQIPTLEECLNIIDGRVPLLIEFKCTFKNYKKLCKAAKRILSDYNGKYFVQSFFPGVLLWYRLKQKDITRGQLAFHYKGNNLIKKFFNCFIVGLLTRPDFVAFNRTEPKKFVFWIQKCLGIFPIGWTFHSKEQEKEAESYFKAFIFEDYFP